MRFPFVLHPAVTRFLQRSPVRLAGWVVTMAFVAGCYSVEQSTVERGYRWIRRGRIDQAITTFEYALRKYPDSVMAQTGLGDACLEAGRNREAVEAYSRALDLLKTSRPPSKNYGEAEVVGNSLVSYQNQGLIFPFGLTAYLHLRRGLAHQGVASSQAEVDRVATLQSAASDYDAALRIAPGYTVAREAREALPK